jgi:hippurate hydrolase
LDQYALVTNDPTATRRVVDAFHTYFAADRVRETSPTSASEDFGAFGTAAHAPSVFWFVGGTDADLYAKAKAAGRLDELPTNHNPRFAPVIHPTLETGVAALVVAAQAWLSS